MALINKLSAIGEAIREKTGKEDLLTLDEMPAEIKSIESGGGDNWYDTFWDVFQQNGTRTDYSQAFRNGCFNAETFKPKYNIKPTGSASCQNMFSNFPDEVDLREILNECGVVLDFSQGIGNNVFMGSKFTALPVINCPSGIYSWFANCKSLHTIEKLILNRDINATYLNGFGNCSALQNIVIEGEIGNSISFKNSSLLTVESVQSIIDCLVDYSGTDTSPVLTLHATVKAKLTEDQIAAITNKNWTLA
jgi:hypothetical protein